MRDKLGFSKDDIIVISVGELNENKNHQVIIRAISLIDNQNIKYVIVGEGFLRQELHSLAISLGVANRVLIMGYLQDVKQVLLMSDIFAFPSRREGLGLAAVEAMAAGLPLAASGVGGMRDYLSGSCCRTCKEQTPEEYASAIIELEKELTPACERTNRGVARSFDYAVTNRIMKDTYERIINSIG